MSESSLDNEHTPTAASAGISVLDVLQIVADNLRVLVLGPLLIGLIALGLSFLIKPTFTAKTTFLPPHQQQSVAASMLQTLGPLAGVAAAGISNPGDRYAALVQSNSIRSALVERFDLMNRYGTKFREDANSAVGAQTKVSTNRNGLISLEVSDHDARFAAELANAHIEELTKLLGRLDLTEAQARRRFFEEQLRKAKDGLVTAELGLKATGISESAIKASPAAAVAGVAALMAQVAAKEVELAAMRGYLTDDAANVRQAQTELAALRRQLSRVEQDTPQAVGGSNYVAKYRDFKYYESLFELVAKQYEVARIDESREGGVIQVVDKALPPERKSAPKKALIAIFSSLGAAFVLLLFVFARHGMRNIDRDSESGAKIAGLLESLRRSIRGS